MKVARKLWTWALALVATFAVVLGLSTVALADVSAPETNKTLHDNGDGSYTLSLSVTGRAETSSDTNKANVIIIFDSSGSMGDNVDTSTYVENPTGRYGLRNGLHVQLYRNTGGNNYSAINNDTTTGTVYYRTGNWPNYRYTQYTGQRYSTDEVTSSDRMTVAKNAVNALTTELLAQNTMEGQDADTVEIAFIDFASNVKNTQGTRTWMTTQAAVSAVVNRFSASGGTNWEAALEAANTLALAKLEAQPDEIVYVIFVSDGNPTFRISSYGNNSDDNYNTPAGVHGSGNSDPNGWNLDAAQNSAAKITGADGMELYAVGVFGDADNMASLGGEYYDAADPDAINEAFADIIGKITNALNVGSVDITDQITDLTATTLVNNATDFKYYRAGSNAEHNYGEFDPSSGEYGTPWNPTADNANEATFTDGEGVEWKLGDNFTLENNITYTVTFTVWPSQASYDLIADLNNGIIDEVPAEYASQVVYNESTGLYGVKTNPDGGAKIDYKVVDETTQPNVPKNTKGEDVDFSGGDTVTEEVTNPDGSKTVITYKKNSDNTYTITKTTSPAEPAIIDNPANTMGLTKTELKLKKLWEDSLDPSQREDVGKSIVLDLYLGNSAYLEDLQLTEESHWTHIDTVTIAPGIMVDSTSPAYNTDPAYTHVTLDGKDYVILETGHDYYFKEEAIDGHFELTNYIYHPMLINGTLYNVEFEKSGDTITGVKAVKAMAEISATNTLKGGINITKVVKDETGADYNDPNPFTVTVTVTDPDGNALPEKTASDGTKYTIDYRIYYGPNNPRYDNPEEGTSADDIAKHRSGHIYATGASFDATIYVGDTIRVVNVEDDSLYTVTETVPTGYDSDYTVTYSISEGTADNPQPFPEGEDPSVQGNSASFAEVTNKFVFGSLEVTKTVTVPEGFTKDANKEFTFTFHLYTDSTKGTELTGNKYSYTKTAADGTTSTGTLEVGGTFTLKDGEKIKFDKLPETAYYEVVETAEDGYEITKTGDTGTIVAKETAEAEFTNTYGVEPVEASIPVKKVLDPADADVPEDATWTFTLAAVSPTDAPMPDSASVDLGAGEEDAFEISFSAPGTYTYKVTESGSVEGVVNDSEATAGKTVTIEVRDTGEGSLTATVTGASEDSPLTFTNTYEVTTVTVEKVWKDNNDEYKTRPGSIKVQLLADDEKYGNPVTLDETGEWTYTWEDLPIYTDATGKTEIKYTVTEEPVEGYATTVGDTTGSAEDGYEITVTNSNVTIPTDVTAFFKKTVTSGNEVSGATFGFTIASASAPAGVTAPMPDPATGTASYLAGETGDKPISTGTITFTEPGTYTYTVTETDKPAGWTAAGSPATVTVVISKADDGTLTAEVTGGAITNTYAASGEAVLQVTKATDGADWPVDESGEPKVLTFTLSGTGGTLPETKTATLTEAGTASFAAITYTQADVANSPFEYTITEDGFGAGWTPSPVSGSITATVTLSDDGSGNITASVEYSDKGTITNTYDASGSIELEAKKAVSGAEWPVDENGEPKAVTFTLSGTGVPLPDDPTITLTNGDAATFGAIEYTLDDAGEEYTYTITETTGFGDGWTPSDPITVTVKVEDNGDGTLTATPTYDPDTQTITNTYDASGEVTLEAVKVLEGREWLEDETYTFTLYDSTGTAVDEVEVTEDNADSVEFETIEYGLADAGKTFEYTISETTDPLPAGVTKSDPITVTVKVEDNGDGTLTATPTYDPDTQTITNTYTPDPVKAQITVDKEISGYIAGEDPNGKVVDRTFTVTMTGPKIDGELTVEITTEGGTGSATFDEIEYTADDMVDDEGNRVTEKEFTYEVTETAGSDAGFTYDENTYEVVVTVTDDPEQGKLVVTGIAMVDDEKDTDVTIVNEFEEEGTEVTLTVNKEIDDQSGSAKDATFKFTIAASEPADAPLPDPTTIEITTSGLKGGKDFAPIEFTESGTYKYTIKEEVVDPAPTGWTYDDHEYEVVIVIDDDFEVAELVVSQKTVDGEETEGDIAVTFTNVYKAAETKATLVVNKEVEDTSGSAPDIEFEFTLAGDDPLPEVTTGKTKAGGSVEFGPITYEKIGDYNYTITETKGDGAGWTYDTNAYPVVVTVTDEGGQLVADVVYNKDESLTDLTVTNIYKPKPATATPKALKTIDDQSNSAPNETFTFNLLDSEGTIVETKTRENGGPVEFTALPFEKVGTYKYVIQEVAGSTKGYTYDIDEHKLTIEVEDKGGELVATVTYEDGEQALITNVYKAEPVKVTLEGVKVLEGGKPLAADDFTFELKDPDGNVVATVSNDAEGNIAFGTYTFEKAGTFTYTATEVKGSDSQITYDTNSHKFTIKVTDKGGQLVAEVTSDDGAKAKFTNTFTPEPVIIDPPVTKVITGDTPATPATFFFQMKAITEGAPMPAGSADGILTMSITGAGSKEFGEAEITETGTYVYEITELKGAAEGYTYDTKAYTLTVTVTQDDKGNLQKEEVYTVDGKEAESPVFTNKYEKPKIPTTGDTTPQVGMLAFAGAVITGIAAFGARRRED